jgi:phospholipase/carboxylesterase
MLLAGAALLSPRGRVLENGMPRFFRQLTDDTFDEADVRRRAKEFADFIVAAREAYGLPTPSRSASRTGRTSPQQSCCSTRRC